MVRYNDDYAIERFGLTQAQAKRLGLCVKCHAPPPKTGIYEQREYNISVLCPKCFDEVSKKDE